MQTVVIGILPLLLWAEGLQARQDPLDTARTHNRDSVASPVRLPGLFSHPSAQFLPPHNLIPDSALNENFWLKTAALRQRLMALDPPEDWMEAYMSFTRQLVGWTRLSEFERMSLVAQRKAEIFGSPYHDRYKLEQTDVLGILLWLIDLLR